MRASTNRMARFSWPLWSCARAALHEKHEGVERRLDHEEGRCGRAHRRFTGGQGIECGRSKEAGHSPKGKRGPLPGSSPEGRSRIGIRRRHGGEIPPMPASSEGSPPVAQAQAPRRRSLARRERGSS